MINTSKIKGCIFDMDGTIMDNMDTHAQAWVNFFKTHHVHITKQTFHQGFAGNIPAMIRKQLGNNLSEDQIDIMHEEKEKIYRQLYKAYITEVKGFSRFIYFLKNKGIKAGLATLGNKKNVDFSLHHLGASGYFSDIKQHEDITHSKPHPEIYLKSLEGLGISASQAIVFEDSKIGIEAASRAGIEVIGVATSHPKEELCSWGAKDGIKDYDELLARLANNT